MNFLCIGSLLLLFQLNLSWTSNYIIKFIGCFMFAAGIKELEAVQHFSMKKCKGNDVKNSNALEGIFRRCILSGVMCFFAAVCMQLLKYLNPEIFAVNAVSVILGCAASYITLNIFRIIYKFIMNNDSGALLSERFVNDSSNIVRLGSIFVKLSVCTLANLVFDIINRFFKAETVSAMAGTAAAVSKILMYIFLIILVFKFNKIRVDYNLKFDMNNENK